MGTQLPSHKRTEPPDFRPMSIVAKRLYQDTTCYRGRLHARRHSVRRGPSVLSPKGHSPQFSANVRYGQTARWIKMPLGMEVGLGPGDFVFDGDPAPQKRAQPPIFCPCLLWPNGWMDEDATWYGSRPRPRPYCVRTGTQLSPRKGHSTPLFGPCLSWPRSPISATDELLFK